MDLAKNELMRPDNLPLQYEALNHEDDETRAIAARQIGYSRDPAGVPYLLKHLLDPNLNVQSEIYSALNRLGTPAEIALLNVLNKETNPELQAAAAEALEKFGTKAAIGALCEAIKSQHVPVRCAAINSLGRIGIVNPEIENILINCLEDHEKIVVKASIQAVGSLGCEKSVTRLLEFVNDSEDGIRYNAIVALGNLRNVHAVMPLIQAMQSTDGYHFKDLILDALTNIGDAIATEPLIKMLTEESKNPTGRFGETFRHSSHIRNALTAVGEPAVMPLIKTILIESAAKPSRPENQEMRSYRENPIFFDISTILRDIGHPAVEPLLALLENKNCVVRKFACVSLLGIPDEKARIPLISLVINDSSSDVRYAAGTALSNYPAVDIFEPLLAEIRKSSAPDLDEAKGIIQCIGKDAVGNLSNSLFCDDAARSSATESIYRNVIACSAAMFNEEDSINSFRGMRGLRRRRGRCRFPA